MAQLGPLSPNAQRILEGKWSDTISWEFFLDNTLPPVELCTAVVCVAIESASQSVVLTKNHRGWEMLGGHIEEGESLHDALVREALEEGGFMLDDYVLFGYRKVTASKPIPHDQQDGFYPFPVSYIPHFVGITRSPLITPSGEEILHSKSFAINDVSRLQIKTEPIIRAGWAAYSTWQT